MSERKALSDVGRLATQGPSRAFQEAFDDSILERQELRARRQPEPLEDLPNFDNVKPHDHLYRGGRPSHAGLEKLKEMGVTEVIDLEKYKNAIEAEKADCKELGIKFISLPMLPTTGPSEQQVNRFLKLVKDNEKSEDPGNIFVHCHEGKDRTGTMVGIERVVEDGWDFERAHAEMRKYRYHEEAFPQLAEIVRRYAEEKGGGKDEALAGAAGGDNDGEKVKGKAKKHKHEKDLPNLGIVEHKEKESLHTLYRGGRPTKKGLEELKEMGITTVVDFEWKPKHVDFEREKCQELNLQFINLPMRPEEGPSKDQVQQFLSAVKDSQKKGEPIYAHCHEGRDRTGAMIGIERVTIDGWKFKDAYDEMLEYHYKEDEYPNLKELVRQYADNK